MPPIDASRLSASDVLIPLLVTVVVLLRTTAAAGRNRRRWQRQALRVVVRGRRTALTSLAVAAIAALATVVAGPLASLAQTTPASNEVSVTDTGFQPASVTLNGSGTIHWTIPAARHRR